MQPVSDAFRSLHLAPEFRVSSTGQAIMHVDEIQNFVETIRHDAVKSIRGRCHVVAKGKVLGQHHGCQIAQIETRRLQRLDKAAGQTYRYAVSNPGFLAMTNFEMYDPAVQRPGMSAFECTQFTFRFILTDKRTGMHIAQ